MPVTLNAVDCPLPVVPSTALWAQDQYSTAGNPPQSVAFASGQTGGIASSALNQNFTASDVLARYGSGGFGVAYGLDVSAGTGLKVNVSAGHAVLDGLLEYGWADAKAGGSVDVAASQSRVWIWLRTDGTLQAVNVSTTKPTGNCVLLGSCVTSGSAVTSVDTSGVVYLRRGTLYRETNDSGAPGDSPDASLVGLITKTQGGFYFWTGTAHRLLGGGTATSVGLTMPTQFAVSGSPVTGAGTLTAAWASQTANTVLCAPNGSAGTPGFRALVSADVPTLDVSKITNAVTTNTTQTITGGKTLQAQTSFRNPSAAYDNPTLGSELLTNPDFASDLSGWTVSGTGTGWTFSGGNALHSTGNFETLSQNVSVTAGTYYVLQFEMTGRTAGTITITIGGETVIYGTGTNALGCVGYYATTTGSVTVAVTPITTFDGSLVGVSLKPITATASLPVQLQVSSGSTYGGMRQAGTTTIYGQSSGQRAFWNNTSGVGTGYATVAGYGTSPAAVLIQLSELVGYLAGRSLVNIYRCVAIGAQALSGATASPINSNYLDSAVAVGYLAFGTIQGTGQQSYGVAVGAQAGNAGTAVTTALYGTFVGGSAGLSGGQYNYAMALGYAARAGAANTCAIGGTTTASVQVVINGTTAVGQLDVNSNSASRIGLIVNGAASQSANLQEWRVNGGAALAAIDAAGRIITAADTIRLATTKTPASAGATGTTGDVCWDASYIYVCTATNTWKRAAIATW